MYWPVNEAELRAMSSGVTPAVDVQVFVDGTDAVARDAASCVEVVRTPLP